MPKKKVILKAQIPDNEKTDALMSPCLYINPDVEFKDIPTTGEEYLLKVMKERENYSQVTKCQQDISKFAKNQSCFVAELPRAYVADIFKPTIEWQNIQVADFSDVRMYISRIISKKSQWSNTIRKIEIEQDNLLGWKRFFKMNEPTLSCVLGLPYTLLDRALEILTDIIDDVPPGKTIDYKTGQWIYAFLACTRQPLLSDTTSILRNLARKCAEIRSHINPEQENSREAVAPLNIFICLVSRYFRQYDLAD
ncbi:Survival of motor neuron protein-interacting protein 1 [Papilio machaon]|uniref:Gem-associated protein 2 n=1 Tax=Papilio machaon TaxID=76193 RepID=A0A194QT89_PAPMA|nr:Survival of motor neuron protein-interacting protein 1 [Papilio machaon]